MPSGFDGVELDGDAGRDDVANDFGELPNRQVLTGADVDVLVAVVVLHQEQAGVGEIVDVEELAPRCAAAPDDGACAPDILASWNLRINAGTTCELVRSKLSPGPYRFVGIAEMKSQPYCRRYAWHNRMPEIFAIAYGSLVGSSGPLSR